MRNLKRKVKATLITLGIIGFISLFSWGFCEYPAAFGIGSLVIMVVACIGMLWYIVYDRIK